jgi:hypothetical protein
LRLEIEHFINNQTNSIMYNDDNNNNNNNEFEIDLLNHNVGGMTFSGYQTNYNDHDLIILDDDNDDNANKMNNIPTATTTTATTTTNDEIDNCCPICLETLKEVSFFYIYI